MSVGPITTGSGKPPRQEDLVTIIRNLQKRVTALEAAVARSQGVTFISPDGNTFKTLSIDNSGTPVWT